MDDGSRCAGAVAERGSLPGTDPVGIVTHCFNHLFPVDVVQLDTGRLEVGDMNCFVGYGTDFGQRVNSLQPDHEPVTDIWRSQVFGRKVKEPARGNDRVYKAGVP